MGQNYSYKQGHTRHDAALYMRDYNASRKIKKLLARLSLCLLIILFVSGLLLVDLIGKELSAIMIAAPVFLMVVWFLVVWFYKGDPPPTFTPPIDINAEFGKQYFQSPESIAKEEAYSRISRVPKGASLDDSIIKTVD
ncbi:MAG: hypothetical protein ACPG47_05255 [Leucothrix sp.]